MFELAVAKGIKGSLTGVVRFPTFLRVVLPGFLGITLLLPFHPLQVNLLKEGLEKFLPAALALLLSALLLGWLTDRLADAIYRLYEGRDFWPDQFRNERIEQIGKDVKNLLAEAKKAKENKEKAKENNRWKEIWAELRRYPVDENGTPYASRPTLLGNILAAYEDYPLSRYGMDSVFFWPRLWLALPRETRQEIDREWAPADGLLNMSVVSYSVGLVSLLAGAVMGLGYGLGLTPSLWHGFQIPFSRVDASWFWGFAAVFSGYLFYRMSIPFHLRNGETFKSVFDLYRDLLKPMVVGQSEEPEKWQRTWAYLQYWQIPCSLCGTFNAVQKETCSKEHCTGTTAESLRVLRGTAASGDPDLLHLILKLEK
jgi:hypothetical protein